MTRPATLSFDNGPEPGVTDRVLDLLAARGIRAYFFVLGRKLGDPERRALVARARAEGHLVGNHTWNHATPLGEIASPAESVAEIARTQTALGPLASPERLFRPFGGGGRLGPHLLNRAAAAHLAQGGYSCVTWNCIPRDWDDAEGWVARGLDICAGLDHPVIVLHDLPGGAMDRLAGFIDALEADGRAFTTDLPAECVAMHRGRATPELAAICKS